MLDDIGRTNFDALHARARRRRWTPGDESVTFCMFDLLVIEGRNVMKQPIEIRKALLAQFLSCAPAHILFSKHLSSDDVEDPVSWLYAHAVELELEGVVAKRKGSVYSPGERSPDWIKIKRPGATPPGRFQRKKPSAG